MQTANKNWLGKNLFARGCLSLPKPLAIEGRQKKPRKLSACGAQAFVAFNSIVLRYALRGSFPEFSRDYGKNMLLSTYYSDRPPVNLAFPRHSWRLARAPGKPGIICLTSVSNKSPNGIITLPPNY
jgi:hypothetical protein